MRPEDVLDRFSCSTRCRGYPRYGMAVSDHHKRLVPVFDGVENVGEVAGRLGGGDISHLIGLSASETDVQRCGSPGMHKSRVRVASDKGPVPNRLRGSDYQTDAPML